MHIHSIHTDNTRNNLKSYIQYTKLYTGTEYMINILLETHPGYFESTVRMTVSTEMFTINVYKTPQKIQYGYKNTLQLQALCFHSLFVKERDFVDAFRQFVHKLVDSRSSQLLSYFTGNEQRQNS